MKLLVDEDSQARRLLDALRHAGHDVHSVAELGRNGLPDAQVFAQAQRLGRALLTHNVADFLALARQAERHAGVLAVFRDGNPRNTMGYQQIVRAIGALEAAGLPVQGQFHILNHWR
jgi:predicted nuclease of predicted toxin-antitoxin system